MRISASPQGQRISRQSPIAAHLPLPLWPFYLSARPLTHLRLSSSNRRRRCPLVHSDLISFDAEHKLPLFAMRFQSTPPLALFILHLPNLSYRAHSTLLSVFVRCPSHACDHSSEPLTS